jgi:hypothetical protein
MCVCLCVYVHVFVGVRVWVYVCEKGGGHGSGRPLLLQEGGGMDLDRHQCFYRVNTVNLFVHNCVNSITVLIVSDGVTNTERECYECEIAVSLV